MKTDPYRAAAAARESRMERVVFTVPRDLLSRFDEVMVAEGLPSRAMALRQAMVAAVLAAESEAAELSRRDAQKAVA